MPGIDDPIDARVRHRGTDGGRSRNGVDDVAQRAEPHDEDVHSRIRASRSRVE